MFYICFGKIVAKSVLSKTQIHLFGIIFSPYPPTPTHNSPTSSLMTSLSQPLNPIVGRIPTYPKLSTITWTNPKKKKKVIIEKPNESSNLLSLQKNSLPISCRYWEREFENGGGMAPIVTTNSEFFLWFLVAPNHHKVYNITSNNNRKRGYNEKDQLQKKNNNNNNDNNNNLNKMPSTYFQNCHLKQQQ